MSPSRPRSRIVRLLLGVSVALGVFAGVEIGLRLLLGPPVPTLEIHLVPRPSDRLLELGEETFGTVFRGPGEHPVFPIGSERPRFVVLGGSSVHEGEHGVGEALEFTQRCADRLGVVGINLGFPGLDSFDLVRIMEQLGPIDLDAMVVYAGHNDLGNVAMGRRYQGLGPFARLELQAGLERLRCYWLLAAGIARVGARKPRQGHPQPLSAAQREAATRHFRANLERMAWISARQERPLVLVVPISRLTLPPEAQPCGGQDCPRPLFEAGMAERYRDPYAAAALLRRARDLDGLAVRASSSVQEAVREVAAAYDHVHLLDAPRLLPSEDGLAVPADELFSDPLHLSEAGHQALGGELATVLGPLLGVAG